MSTKRPQLTTTKYMWKLISADNRFIVALLTAPFAALFLGNLLPFFISGVLARLATNNTQALTGQQLLLLVLIAAVGIVCNRISFGYLLSSQARMLERLQNDTLANLLKKSNSFFENQMTGKLTTDVFSLSEGLMQFQDVLVINMLPFVINIVVGIGIVMYHSVFLGMGLLVLTAVVIGSALYASTSRKIYRIRRHEAQRKLRGYFADILANNATVRLFAREKYEQKKVAELNRILTKHRIEDWQRVTRDGNNRIIMIVALQIVFILAVVKSVQADPTLLAAGIFAFGFTITLSNKLFEISGMIRGYENAVTNAEPMVKILQTEPTILDPKIPMKFEIQDGAIDFQNVTFWYGDAKNPLLHDFSLHIKPGEKVGLVGPSGGGKTTLTKLLLRFMDIQDGIISIDSQDISKVTQSSVRRSISYVPQDPTLFHRTLLENMNYGSPLASKETVIRASKKAHAHEFIENLPEEYNTLVGERGVKLSGGQRQRVAIARAMLKNAPILVLDEATSALDSDSEVYIQDALWKLMEKKTAIVIAHRLSTIQKMDRIIVLDGGKIVEQGTHKELLKKKSGLYKKLWSHQSGGFLQEE